MSLLNLHKETLPVQLAINSLILLEPYSSNIIRLEEIHKSMAIYTLVNNREGEYFITWLEPDLYELVGYKGSITYPNTQQLINFIKTLNIVYINLEEIEAKIFDTGQLYYLFGYI